MRAGHQEPRVGRDGAGRLDDHPAARARALHQGPAAQLRPQDPRGQAGLRARGEALQDLDPARVPQLGALRHGQRPHRDRRRGGGGDLLRQARQGPRAARVRAAGRPAPGALAVQPVPQRPGRDRAPQRRAPEDVRERLHHALRVRRGGQQGPRPQARPALRAAPRALLLRLRAGEADRAVRRRRRCARGGLRIHTTINPKMQDLARDAINSYYGDPAGPSSAIVVDRPGHRQDQGDGLERHLRRAPLQPRRPGPPPARLGLQDDGADRGDPQGRRPRLHLLHLQAAQHRRPRVRRTGRSRPSATPTRARSASRAPRWRPTTPSTRS